jgi:hypothetical protein
MGVSGQLHASAERSHYADRSVQAPLISKFLLNYKVIEEVTESLPYASEYRIF